MPLWVQSARIERIKTEVLSMSKTVTSLFQSESQASSVVRRLEEAGVSSGDISVFAEGGMDRLWSSGNGTGYDKGLSGPDRLTNYLEHNGVPTRDARAFAEGVRRGHTLIAVRCDDDEVDEVVSILDGNETLDLDEQQRSWRSEGWTGFDAGSDATLTRSETSYSDRSDATDDEVIPVAEEELHVGKRDVNRGRVRIHSHVVERPVQEQVTLRDETVEVERRPASSEYREGTLSGDPFQERSIEVEERDEEAVVSKQARVREELVVRKGVEQRTETVSDTVRKTEVDVEDDRSVRGRDTKSPRDRKI
jgi:uncharacterized protein (TIGR02271 family)